MAPLRTLLKNNPNIELDIDVSNVPTVTVSIPDANLRAKVRDALGLGPNAPHHATGDVRF